MNNRKTKTKERLVEPMIRLLEDLANYSSLNSIQITNLLQYSEYLTKTLKNNDFIEKSEDKLRIEKDLLQTDLKLVKGEISADFYTIKSTELILGYARLECAIDDLVRLFFKNESFDKLPDLDAIKINPLEFAKFTKPKQREYLADQYIAQKSANQKYGFQRFEAVISPIFGKSNLSTEIQLMIFKLSQIRNIAVHKNGFVDAKCQKLLHLPKNSINKRIKLSESTMEELMNSILIYCSDINDRILSYKKSQASPNQKLIRKQ